MNESHRHSFSRRSRHKSIISYLKLKTGKTNLCDRDQANAYCGDTDCGKGT